MEYCAAVKKKELLSFAIAWMDLQIIGVDPGRWNLCVVAVMDKFTRTTKSCGEKGMMPATLSRGEHPDPCLDRLLLLFWAQYIEDDPRLLCTGSQLQKTKESMLLIT